MKLYSMRGRIEPTSNIMLQMFCMQSVMASAVPDTVTALSVELGSISDATWIEAPVV